MSSHKSIKTPAKTGTSSKTKNVSGRKVATKLSTKKK